MVKILELRDFKGFQVLSGPNQSSSYQWVNGVTTQSISYYYYVQALEEGTLTIGPASIEVDNQSLTTEAITVEVGPGQAPQTNTTQQSNQQVNPNQISNSNDWKERAAESIFVKMYTDKANPYVGEQVFLYTKLYQRINTYGSQITDMPDFNGFWKQEIEVNTDDWRVETLDGVQYNTLIIGKYALFPQRSGSFDIPPVKLSSILMIQEPTTRNFFGMQIQSMGYREVEYSFASAPFKINVQDLPLAGKPANFSGAVGSFNFEASIDSTEIEQGEALTLKTEISGTGNIMAVGEPIIDFPKQFEVYDPETSENISKRSNYVNGSKSFNYLLVAKQAGSFNIEPIEFSYFDLSTKSYKTIQSNRFNIRVLGDPNKENVLVSEKEDVAKLDEDIRYISLDTKLKPVGNNFLGSATFYASAAAPIALCSLLFVFLRFRENQKSDTVFYKHQRASKEAKKRMKKAQKFLENEDKKGFYNELASVLNGYVSDKFNISQAELNKELVQSKFAEKGVSESLASDFIQVLEQAEMALYSPTSADTMKADFSTIQNWIIEIEHEIS